MTSNLTFSWVSALVLMFCAAERFKYFDGSVNRLQKQLKGTFF